METNNDNSVLFSLNVEESPDFRARMNALADAVDATQSRIGATIKAIADGTIAEAKRIDQQTQAIGPRPGAVVQMANESRKTRPTSAIRATGGLKTAIRDADDLDRKVKSLSEVIAQVGSESQADDWVNDFRNGIAENMSRVEAMQKQLADLRMNLDTEPVNDELNVLKQIFEQVAEVAKQPAFEEWSAMASQNVEETRQEIERLREVIADPIELKAAADSGELEAMLTSLSAKTKELTEARDRHAESLINEAEAYGRTSSRLEMFQKQLSKFGEDTPDWPKILGTKEMMDAVGAGRQLHDQLSEIIGSDDIAAWAERSGTDVGLLAEQLEWLKEILSDPEKFKMAVDYGNLSAVIDEVEGSVERLSDASVVHAAAVEEQQRQIASLSKDIETQDKILGRYAQQQERSFDSMVRGAEMGAQGFGKLTRGLALMGFAFDESDESTKKALQTLAKIQGAIDVTAGAYKSLQAAQSILKGLAGYIDAMGKSSRIEARHTRTANELSRVRQRELRAETAETLRLKAATDGLAGSRGRDNAASGMAGGGGGRRGGRRGGGRGAGLLGFGASMAGMGMEADLLSMGMDAMPAGRGRMLRGARAGAMRGLGRLAPMVGASSATGGGGAAAVGGGLLGVGAAGAAALGGVAFAGKSAFEMAKEARTSGIGGGAKAGSYTEAIGASKANPFSWIVASGDMWRKHTSDQLLERRQKQSEELQMRQSHLDNLASIEIDGATAIAKANRSAAAEIFALKFDTARTPEARQELLQGQEAKVRSRFEKLSGKYADGQGGFNFDTDIENDPVGSRKTIADREELISLAEELSRVQKQRIGVIGEVSQKSQAAIEKELSGIESLMRARKSEKEALLDRNQSAREQFADLGKGDKQNFLKALKKARQGGDLNDREVDALSKVDTEETREFVSDAKAKEARAAGFDDKVIKDDVAKAKSLGAEEDALRKALSAQLKAAGDNKSVDDIKAIEARQKRGESIEVIDRSQIELKFEEMDARMVDQVAKKVNDVVDQRVAILEAAIKDENERRDTAERERERERRGKAYGSQGRSR